MLNKINNIIKKRIPNTLKGNSDNLVLEAKATSSNIMVGILADVMVKTNYGLTYDGISIMFRAQADLLVDAAESLDKGDEKDGLYLVAKEIIDLADRLHEKGKAEKS